MNPAWEARVQALEAEGLTRSDAQGAADVEDSKAGRARFLGAAQVAADATARRRLAWAAMCRHDGINPASTFVVFSDGNPGIPEYNAAVRAEQEAVRQLNGGGR